MTSQEFPSKRPPPYRGEKPKAHGANRSQGPDWTRVLKKCTGRSSHEPPPTLRLKSRRDRRATSRPRPRPLPSTVRASSGSRKQGRTGPASPVAPSSVVLEAPQDGGEDGGRGVSGLFQGGGGDRAGPGQVTASATGRPPAQEGGAPCAAWPALTMPAPAGRAGGTGPGAAQRRSSLKVGPLG